MLDIRIEAAPEELADLRQCLLTEMGEDLDLQEVSSPSPSGELREPLLIALIVALGGPAVVKGFVAVVNRWLEHREKMEAEKNRHEEKMEELKDQHEEKEKELELRFAILHKEGYESVTLDELSTRAGETTK